MSDGGYEYWPVNRADLDPHYDRVEQMLNLQRYPFEHEPYASTPKTIAFKEAAEANGLEWFLPQLAVTFGNKGRAAGAGRGDRGGARRTSTAARARRASCAASATSAATTAPRTRSITTTSRTPSTTVRRSARWPTCAGSARARTAPATRSCTPTSSSTRRHPVTYELTCDHLILSAGTLGTTNLLLRNRSAFPAPLAQARQPLLRQRRPADAGAQHHAGDRRRQAQPRIVDPGYGPVITSTARMPDACDPGGTGRGFYLQDAGFPQHLAWILHVVSAPKQLWRWREGASYLVKNWLQGSPETDVTGQDRRPDAAVRALLGRPAAARHGPRRARRAHVPAQRPSRHRLAQGVGLGRVLQPPAQHVARLRHLARWSLRGQSAVVPASA